MEMEAEQLHNDRKKQFTKMIIVNGWIKLQERTRILSLESIYIYIYIYSRKIDFENESAQPIQGANINEIVLVCEIQECSMTYRQSKTIRFALSICH